MSELIYPVSAGCAVMRVPIAIRVSVILIAVIGITLMFVDRAQDTSVVDHSGVTEALRLGKVVEFGRQSVRAAFPANLATRRIRRQLRKEVACSQVLPTCRTRPAFASWVKIADSLRDT
ncbi:MULTISPECIES: hypothetical protein [unclassified Ensifer]|uniref:hypothetical protein n=1 Tax=unclassified Ensifer TaxID=2633371 RepID=UPI0008130507|nr:MULTISPECIES: hypothetical protein [unclassified Ensifer]OCP21423.1 hypothetical protein BC361_26520 [Ensifer sp. LC54]OCP26842.1 hypothetical protein BC363_16055 [Ensifer sp. LC384]